MLRTRKLLIGQTGFSLIESMMALVILTVGMLALAGMQAIALVYNVDANELGQATSLATEMVERIQSNKQNIDAYAAINTSLGNPCPFSPLGAPPPRPTSRGDCLQWQANITNSGLSNVEGSVVVVAPTGIATSIVSPTGGAVETVIPLIPVSLSQTNVAVTVFWMTKKGGGFAGNMQKASRLTRVTLRTVVTPP